MSLRRPVAAACGLAMLASACSAACPTVTLGNASGVVLLADFSQTFAPYTTEDEAALKQVAAVIETMIYSQMLQQPVKIVWAAFGDDGLRPLLPCGPALTFRQRLTASSATSQDIVDIGALRTFLSECSGVTVSLSRAAQRYTDVSGALAFGAETLNQVGKAGILVLYSDLKEDVPLGRTPTSFALAGAKVVLLWRPGLDDRNQPSAVQSRVEAWRLALLEAGGSQVCALAAKGLTAGDLGACLGATDIDDGK